MTDWLACEFLVLLEENERLTRLIERNREKELLNIRSHIEHQKAAQTRIEALEEENKKLRGAMARKEITHLKTALNGALHVSLSERLRNRWRRWRTHRRTRQEARESLRQLPLLQAHFVDIHVRVGGEWKQYEGDFLKWLR